MIELPDLVQRIRVKTDEMRSADKLAAKLGDRLDRLRGSADDSSGSMGDLADSTDDYNASTTKANRSTDDAVKKIKTLRETSDEAGRSVGLTADEIGRLRGASAGASSDVGHLGDEAEHAASSMRNLGDETDRSSRTQTTFRKNTDKSNLTLSSFVKRALLTVATLGALKVALLGLVLPGAIAQLGDILAAAAAGAVAFTSAIAPAVGAVAALPAGLLAFASVAGVFKVVTSGVGAAVKAIQTYGEGSTEAKDKLKALDAQQRGFALDLNGFLNQLKRLGATIRLTALPFFGDAMDRLRPLIPLVSDELAKLGSVVGNFVSNAARLVASGPFSKDIQTILSRNNKLVGLLGRAFLQLLSAVRHVVIAAGPMTKTFATWILAGSKWINVLAETNRRNGDLAAFFKETVSVMRTWGHILADLAVGLFNIFKIGKSLGDDMIKTLRGNARAFKEWTDSVGGQNRITKFFNDARPVLAQIGRLATAVGKSLFRIFDKVDTGGLLKQLRTDLLPVLEKLLIRTGKSGLTSAVIQLAVAFGKLLNALPVNAISEMLIAVAKLATAFVKLGKAHPVILQLVGSLLVMKVALKAISGFGKFTGISALVSGLQKVGPAGKAGEKGLIGFVQGFRGATGETKTLANKFGDNVYRGIAGGVNKVKGLFTRGKSIDGVINKSLGRSSGGIRGKATKLGSSIASGIGRGLSGVKDVAGKALSGMASAFAKTGGVIKVASKAFLGLTKATALAGAAIVKTTAKIVAQRAATIAGAIAQGVIKAATIAWTAVQWLLNVALDANPIGLVVVAIGALVAAIVLAYQHSATFRKIVDATFSFLKKIVVGTINFVVGFVKSHWQLILGLMTGPIGLAVLVIAKNWDRIKKIVSVASKIVGTIIRRYVGLWRSIIVGAFNAIRAYFKFVWNAIRVIVSTYIRVVTTVIKTAINLITGYFHLLGRVVGIVRDVFGNIASAIRDRIGDAVGFVKGIRDRIIGFFVNAGTWLFDAGKAIIKGLIGGIADAIPGVQSILGKVTGWIPDWKGPIGKDENLLYNAGRAIMRGLTKGIREGAPEVRGALNGVTKDIRNGIQVEDGSFVSPSFFAGEVTNALKVALADSKNAKTKKLGQTSIAAEARKRIEKQAQAAAQEENRLRSKLPLLSGADKKAARDRIRELQRQQARLTRQSTALLPVSTLRKQRAAALKQADEDAKKARLLREQLPGLEGKARDRAKAEIDRLAADRKDQLKTAQDISKQLIKGFNELPKAVQKLIKDIQDQRQERRQKQRERERRQQRQDSRGSRLSGGSSGPTGSASDPVFTANPFNFGGGGGGGGKKGKDDGHLSKIEQNTRETKRVQAEFGRRLPPQIADLSVTTKRVGSRTVDENGKVGARIVGAVNDAGAKNARTVAGEVRRAGRSRDARQQAIENAVNKAEEASNLHLDRVENQVRTQSIRAGQQDRELAGEAKVAAAKNAAALAKEVIRARGDARADSARVKAAVDKATAATNSEIPKARAAAHEDMVATRTLWKSQNTSVRQLMRQLASAQMAGDIVNASHIIQAITASQTGIAVGQGAGAAAGAILGNHHHHRDGGNNRQATTAGRVTQVHFHNARFDSTESPTSVSQKLRMADVIGRSETVRR